MAKRRIEINEISFLLISVANFEKNFLLYDPHLNFLRDIVSIMFEKEKYLLSGWHEMNQIGEVNLKSYILKVFVVDERKA